MTTVGEFVVGVDGSPNGAAALRWALAEANLRNTVLTAVYAWGHLPPGQVGGGHVFEPGYGPEEADADLVAAIDEAAGSAAVAQIDRRATDAPRRRPAALTDARGAGSGTFGPGHCRIARRTIAT